MGRMGAAIAKARQQSDGRHKENPFGDPPRYVEARQPDGSVCPVCLRFGRQDCKTHSDERKPTDG